MCEERERRITAVDSKMEITENMEEEEVEIKEKEHHISIVDSRMKIYCRVKEIKRYSFKIFFATKWFIQIFLVYFIIFTCYVAAFIMTL